MNQQEIKQAAEKYAQTRGFYDIHTHTEAVKAYEKGINDCASFIQKDLESVREILLKNLDYIKVKRDDSQIKSEQDFLLFHIKDNKDALETLNKLIQP